jgi:hypothetical protein
MNVTDTMYRLHHQAGQLDRIRQLRAERHARARRVERRVGLTLMGDEEKPPRYTDQFHYIFYGVQGNASRTIGDGYDVR